MIVISSQKSKGKSNCNDLKVQNIAPAAGYIRGHNFWCKNSILVFSHFQLKSPRSGENFLGGVFLVKRTPPRGDPPPSPGFTHLSRCFNFFSSLKPYDARYYNTIAHIFSGLGRGIRIAHLLEVPKVQADCDFQVPGSLGPTSTMASNSLSRSTVFQDRSKS